MRTPKAICWLWVLLASVSSCSAQRVSLYDASSIKCITLVPGYLVAKANSLIILKTGRTFFRKYIHRIEDETTKHFLDWNVLRLSSQNEIKKEFPRKLPYCVSYVFKIPGKPWIDEPVMLYFDSNGRTLSDMNLEPIPYCASDPGACTFRIDSTAAVGIAKKAGLKKGFGRWKVIFKWDGGGKFVWSITNVLIPSGDKGEEIDIDANSGAVVHRYEWSRQY